MSRNKSSLTTLAPIAAVVLALGIIVAIYGFGRGGGEETGTAAAVQTDSQAALALRLLEQGEPENALKILNELAETSGRRGLAEDLSLARIRACRDAGLAGELSAAVADFERRFPASEHLTTVKLYNLTAEVQSVGLRNPALLQNVEAFVAANPRHPGVGDLQLALARHEIAIGDTASATRRLQLAAAMPDLSRTTRQSVHAELGNMNLAALLRGDTGTGRDIMYTVRSGDSIYEIARAHKLTSELLMRANNISDPRRLQIGQTLRIPAVDFTLVADIAENTLALYNHGELVKVYNVRTGRVEGTTPVGEFRILNKKTDPTWRPGDGRVYLPGDPNNELGSRWMAFEGDILGIHGTLSPETVGHYASNGCIGMTTADVEELFDLVNIGTPLQIKGSQNLANARVIPAREIPPPLSATEIASRR